MSINLTDELLAKTKKGKIASAKQVFLEGDKENLQQIGEKTHQLEDAIKDIAVSGGASTANAVSYNNETSGMTAITAQGAIDELAAKNKEQDSTIGTKAEKSEVATELDKKFDKENIAQEFGDSEDKVVSQSALPFRYIQSEEFIFAKVDANDKLLFGIQWDGTPVFSKTSAVEDRLQTQVTLLAEKVATIMGDEDTTNVIDTMNELKKFFAEIENTQTLTSILANLDKTTIKDEEGKVHDTPFRVIENEEFIMAIVDADDRILYGIYRDTGKPYYPQNDMYHISQSEEFLWVILDAANHPLLGIQQDGTCWAAKAQWLDDIKAIKNVLSSIDETLKTFQKKEDGKGLINLEIADSFFYISNDEYIIAVVDAEDRILAGIKYDGEPYFPNHEMYSVITNEEWLYAIIDAENKVLGGFRADDGHMIVGGIDISTFIVNATIDVVDIKKRTAHLSTIENDEYLAVEIDAEGKVIGYIASDGSHYLYKVKSETIPTEFEHIEDPEGRTEITTDSDDKVMSYRDSQGKKHEHDMEVTNLDVSNINLQGNSVNNIQDALKANGFNVKAPIDWSDNSFIQIPEPRFAIINVTNIDSMPTTKQDNKEAFLEFWDMQGNYFKKHAILNAQGNSTMGWSKKNVSMDICDDEWIGDETPKIRIGDWVPQDSFHLKAYHTDFFKGVGAVAYKLYNQIVKTRGNMYDRPWKKALIDMSAIGTTTKSFENPYVGEYELLTDTGARCFPDGFPVAVYLNGAFYGVFSFQLKKHRDNYHMNKSNAKHVHLDGDIYEATLFNGRNKINWEMFEIRNPKGLYAIGGNKYDADVKQEEIAGEAEVNTWIEAGKLPDGKAIDSKIKKSLQMTAEVKKYIQDFADAMPTIKKARAIYEASSKSEEDLSTLKSIYEKYFDKENMIDYMILSDLIYNYDGFSKNWQWFTYDGVKWWVGLYDTDMSFGGDIYYIRKVPTTHVNTSIGRPNGYVVEYYSSEMENRYSELAKLGIISYEHIFSMLKDWTMRIGTTFYKEEYKKWYFCPCISNSTVRSRYWELVKDSSGNLQTDTSETFDATHSYNIGDEVSFGLNEIAGFYKFRCLKATSAISTNVPHSISDYSPISKFGHVDSIYRAEKWIKENVKNMDSVYHYNRNV
uniref:CotH kinase protein n=1 Tax=CrAss-like virus sp. ctcfK29 TaxID=2826827 RepID=A0A8S5MJ77_9CAUD|nr:MAG TPA: CotH kinase protein [CrAss-like virus sp. ctcfK29]